MMYHRSFFLFLFFFLFRFRSAGHQVEPATLQVRIELLVVFFVFFCYVY